MISRESIKAEIDDIPDELLEQLSQYIKEIRNEDTPEELTNIATASERVLAKDWNRKEEDEAWQDL